MYHPKLANFVILTSLLFAAGFGTGCNNLRHVDGAMFMQIAAHSAMMNTMSCDQYIGATPNAAYIQSWRAGILLPDTNCVYWTGLSELPSGVAKKLRAGENPWADARFDPKITVLGDAPPMHQVLRAPSGD